LVLSSASLEWQPLFVLVIKECVSVRGVTLCYLNLAIICYFLYLSRSNTYYNS